MHLLISHAAPASEAGRAALAALPATSWPNLASLLARLGRIGGGAGDEYTLSTPEERVIAQSLGWTASSDADPALDGRLPFAAHAARSDGIDPSGQAWGLVTPTHWHVDADHVSLVDPGALALGDEESRALFDATQGLFTSEGFECRYGAELRWYLAHEGLEGFATASLERAVGRNVERWLKPDVHRADPPGALSRRIRRLQSEVQMLLYAHPVNAAREQRGQLPVNSFWLSGCGAARETPGEAPLVEAALREGALAEDWPGWADAWRALDAGPALAGLAAARARGEPVRLTLAGERSAATFAAAPAGLVARLRARVARPDVRALLQSL